MPVSPRSLATLPLGVDAVVRAVHGSRAIARRLMELGLVPGTAGACHPGRPAWRPARAARAQLRLVDPARRRALHRDRRAGFVTPAFGAAAPAEPERAPVPAAARPVVLVAGNPNSGKSTLFNALTGADVKVGNYPGVTVTRTTKRGRARRASVRSTWSTCPGPTASARDRRTNRSPSTPCSGRAGVRPDAVLIVADATALGRALYLAGEIIDTGARAVDRPQHGRRGADAAPGHRRGAPGHRPGRAGGAHRRARAARARRACAGRSPTR